MDVDSFVVVCLHTPREQWWGLLREITPAGVTVRGLPLDSFEAWARSVARGQELEVLPSLVFFPMSRVERIYEDESTLLVASHAQRFRDLTGRDVRFHLLSGEAREH